MFSFGLGPAARPAGRPAAREAQACPLASASALASRSSSFWRSASVPAARWAPIRRQRRHFVGSARCESAPAPLTAREEAVVGPPPVTPIVEGIKAVAVGKKGSKETPADVVERIVNEMRAGAVNPVQRAAFLAALRFKGLTPAEREAFIPVVPYIDDPRALAAAVLPDAPDSIRRIAEELLAGRTLDRPDAAVLADFFFDFSEQGEGPVGSTWHDAARALCATVLRVRYETAEEYQELVRAMNASISEAFKAPTPPGEPILQLAEPFDGVLKSYIATPLLAHFFQTKGYRVVSLCGRTSGPKYAANLRNVVSRLAAGEGAPAAWARSMADLAGPKPPLGWFVDQADLSPALDRWVDIRRAMIKRPFVATIEKLVDAVRADIIVTSAFHPSYTEKMVEQAERAGYRGAVIVRRGLEGSLPFSPTRAAEVLCTARQADGSYVRQEFRFKASELVPGMGEGDKAEPAVEPDAARFAALAAAYAASGGATTGDEALDGIARATCAGLEQAVQWVRSNMQPAL
eukprot:tig00020734_g13576.t1